MSNNSNVKEKPCLCTCICNCPCNCQCEPAKKCCEPCQCTNTDKSCCEAT